MPSLSSGTPLSEQPSASLPESIQQYKRDTTCFLQIPFFVPLPSLSFHWIFFVTPPPNPHTALNKNKILPHDNCHYIPRNPKTNSHHTHPNGFHAFSIKYWFATQKNGYRQWLLFFPASAFHRFYYNIQKNNLQTVQLTVQNDFSHSNPVQQPTLYLFVEGQFLAHTAPPHLIRFYFLSCYFYIFFYFDRCCFITA